MPPPNILFCPIIGLKPPQTAFCQTIYVIYYCSRTECEFGIKAASLSPSQNM